MEINIHNIDLNLLVIFDALMVERNVTKAAESVNLSQSAMSHALNRLRRLLDDPVLVRTEKGMRPTARAKELELPVREVLTNIQHHLYAPQPFAPMNSHRTFVIYSTEYFECVYFPLLIARLERKAPGIKLKLGILERNIPEKRLTNGDVNFVIGVEDVSDVPKRIHSRPWAEDSLSCLVREQNAEVGDHISLAQYSQMKHIYHSTFGTPFAHALLDRWLQENGIQRRVAVTTTGYLSAAMIVAETNYLLTLPTRLAQRLVETMGLRMVIPPENFPGYKLNLMWHPIYEKDPACMWLRGQLIDIVQTQTIA